jgi:glycosyltransferase involved in cell wall biosynthesis
VAVLTGSPGPTGDDDSGVEIVRPTSLVSIGGHAIRARRRITERGFDVVHGHLSVLSPFTTVLSRHAARTGTPLVLTVHSMLDGRHSVVRTVGGLAGWRDWPAQWTAVSTAVAGDLRGLLRADTDVAVVPNAVESDWWHEAATRSRNGHVRPITFVSVMRMVERKRPLALVRALHSARRHLPSEIPMRVVLVGDGPLASIVWDEVRRRRMSDWVAMTGQMTREQIRDIYADADVYVAPADRESFGIAALEARAAGLAVIAMRTGGVGDFVMDGVEGALCADDADLSRALQMMAAQPAAVAAMKTHNSAVAPNISWSTTLGAYSRSYEQAASMPGIAVRRSASHGSPAARM